MTTPSKKGSFFGSLASIILKIFARTPARPDTKDLKQADFKTSTQSLGLTFTEKIRNTFRFKWLKKL